MTNDFKENWPDMHMKHLEMIQNVVSRMANNSANTKNYCMTISAALIGLAAAIQKPAILLYSVPIILIFSFIDAQYLRLERAFIAQYNDVAQKDCKEKPDFSISLPSNSENVFFIFSRWSISLFYIPIIITFVFLRCIM